MHYPPPSTLHPTPLPTQQKTAVSSSPRDEQECAVTVLYSGEPLAYSFQQQHYTTCKKAKPIPSKLTGGHNRLTNHLRIYRPVYRPAIIEEVLNIFLSAIHIILNLIHK